MTSDDANVTIEMSEDVWDVVEENLEQHVNTCERMLENVKARDDERAQVVGTDLDILVEEGMNEEVERSERPLIG
jgi:hypothetical protein